MSMSSIDAVRRSVTSTSKSSASKPSASKSSASKSWAADSRNLRQTLALSEIRTYDAACETLCAYKLTGNFPTELEIVLKDLHVLDKVTFDIKPKSPLSDCRHVEFRPTDRVHRDRFTEIMRTVEKRIGADSTQSWWVRLFQ
jgi:hypothetical protein